MRHHHRAGFGLGQTVASGGEVFVRDEASHVQLARRGDCGGRTDADPADIPAAQLDVAGVALGESLAGRHGDDRIHRRGGRFPARAELAEHVGHVRQHGRPVRRQDDEVDALHLILGEDRPVVRSRIVAVRLLLPALRPRDSVRAAAREYPRHGGHDRREEGADSPSAPSSGNGHDALLVDIPLSLHRGITSCRTRGQPVTTERQGRLRFRYGRWTAPAGTSNACQGRAVYETSTGGSCATDDG